MKFGGDWSGGLWVLEGHRCKRTITLFYIGNILYIHAKRGPVLLGTKYFLTEHFTLHKVFSRMTHLGFGVWDSPGSGGHVGRTIRTISLQVILTVNSTRTCHSFLFEELHRMEKPGKTCKNVY